MKEIPLTRGKVALVDDADFEWLNQTKWHARKNKNGNWYASGYLKKGKGDYKSILMHREILRLTDPKIQGEHKDGNGLNNQRGNLRLATNQQNSMNTKKKKNAASKYKGVSWAKTNSKWVAKIRLNGTLMHLGYFKNEIAAAYAYNNAAIMYFGEFANINIFT